MVTNKDSASSGAYDAAARRSSPFLRKAVAVLIITICFGGLLLVSFFPDIPVSIIEQVPQKEIFWGMIKWGKHFEVTTAPGFVFPEWAKYSITSVIGFLFGTGASKASK